MVTTLNPRRSRRASSSRGARVGAAEGEDPVAFHVMDVAVEGVAGDPPAAEFAGDALEFFARRVAVAALMIAEGPAGRQRHATGQFGEASGDVGGSGPGEEVKIDGPAFGDHLPTLGIGLAQIPVLASGMVPEEAGDASVPEREGEGDRDISPAKARVEGGGVLEDVDVPQLPPEPAAVEGAGGFAEAEQALARGEAEGDSRFGTGEPGGARGGVEDPQSVRIDDPPRAAGEVEFEPGGGGDHGHARTRAPHRNSDVRPLGSDHGPRGFEAASGRTDGEPEQVGGEDVQVKNGAGGAVDEPKMPGTGGVGVELPDRDEGWGRLLPRGPGTRLHGGSEGWRARREQGGSGRVSSPKFPQNQPRSHDGHEGQRRRGNEDLTLLWRMRRGLPASVRPSWPNAGLRALKPPGRVQPPLAA
jgi:hypothetical protein